MRLFESVPTTELAEGDLISHYGCVLRLENRQEWADHPYGPVVTFDGVFVDDQGGNNAITEAFPQYRVGGKPWKVQGNSLARWNRWIGEEEQSGD